MQTADITATNAAKSIGSSSHDRPMGPTLAQSGVVGRNPEPDGPMYSQIIGGVIHCRSRLLFHPKGFTRVACHIPGSSLVATARSSAGGCPGVLRWHDPSM
jgi:hypothetical protein